MAPEQGGETPQGNAAETAEDQYQGKHEPGSTSEDPRIAQARSEAIEERKQRQALEGRIKELENAQLTEEQRRSQRLSELESGHSVLETQLQEQRNRYAVTVAAVAAGSTKPEAVARLVDFAALKHDKAGEVTNAVEVVTAAKETYPELFGEGAPGSADGGKHGGGAPSQPDMETALRRAAGH
jgi:uncharacterized protein involved in type VI secretion and phage assembly